MAWCLLIVLVTCAEHSLFVSLWLILAVGFGFLFVDLQFDGLRVLRFDVVCCWCLGWGGFVLFRICCLLFGFGV